MTSEPPRADLAVVIPCLDEATSLPLLLADLAAQRGVCLEVAVTDGGSTDDTVEAAEAFGRAGSLPLTVLRAPRGRGRQLNAGAAATAAPEVLFLHADTRLGAPDLLARALAHLAREWSARRHDRVAGHFGLRFRRTDPAPSLAYHYFESKTFLNRPGCVNGDQGLLLGRRYFEELGGFDEEDPFYEDARLADRVFGSGAWTTLPGEVSTSARRFEAEGLRERQTVNVLLRGCETLGLDSFLREARGLYRTQAQASRLDPAPFFLAAHRAVWAAGTRQGLCRWRGVGAYVRGEAWQIAFWLDCRRNFRRGFRPGRGPTPMLDAYDCWAAGLGGAPQAWAAAVATAGWFYGTIGRRGISGIRERINGRGSGGLTRKSRK